MELDSNLTSNLTVEGEPTVVYICGSRKFKQQIQEACVRETLKGNLVMFHSLLHLADEEYSQIISSSNANIVEKVEIAKLCVADELLVIAPDGYVGEHTQKKIDLAKELDLSIRFLEGPTQ